MGQVIHESGTEEELSVRKPDLLDDSDGSQGGHRPVGCEQRVDVEDKRETHERLAVGESQSGCEVRHGGP